MKLITTTLPHCVPASFAMVMGIELDEMLNLLGHNGLEKICDEEPPNCYRGFHPQEIVDKVLTRGWVVCMIELEPQAMHGSTLVDHGPLIWHLPEQRFYAHMVRDSGVVFGALPNGHGHAMAWDHEALKMYDPRGQVTPITDMTTFRFEPRQFFIMRRTI